MHLLSTYALACHAKISKPEIYESFTPTPSKKYITFQAQTTFDSRNYSFWQDVIDVLHPLLSKNDIQIVQLGAPGDRLYNRVADLRGKTSISQLAYIIKRAALHLGPDSFDVHLASSYDVPIVGLYSSNHYGASRPYFGSPENQIIFKAYERVGNGKPSYSPTESPKSINKITPEEIANAVFKLLKIDFLVPFQTVYTGDKYGATMMREAILNTPTPLAEPESQVEVRADMFYDEKLLAHHLSYLQKVVLIINQDINTDLLKHFKSKIQGIVYEVGANHNPKVVAKLISVGVPVMMISYMTPEEVAPLKIDYYEFGTINVIPGPDQKIIEELRKDIGNLYYRTSKIVIANDKVYASHAACIARTELRFDFEYQKLIDSPEFWKDMNFVTIVKKVDPTKSSS
jgi:hypothetical protein